MKVVHRSKWTGEDFAAIEAQIADANEVYQKYIDEYNWGIQNGSASYAKRARWPRVTAAKTILDTLEQQYENMLSVMGKKQAIDIVDTTIYEATAEQPSEIPWKTIGLVAGAIILIVIVVKLV